MAQGFRALRSTGNSTGKRVRSRLSSSRAFSLVVLVKFRFGMNAPSTVGHGRDRMPAKVARQPAAGMASFRQMGLTAFRHHCATLEEAPVTTADGRRKRERYQKSKRLTLSREPVYPLS